jgi:hypothetical protein
MTLLRYYLYGLLTLLLLAGCSPGKMVVRGSQSIMDSSLETMNRETDLELARQAMPANLKLLEGMLIEDPGNTELRLYAAQGFYGYAFGFIELEDPLRAAQLYRRCYDHARIALARTGVKLDPEHSTTADFEAAVSQAGKRAVPGLFWTASCLSNWINLNRDSPASIAELSSAATAAAPPCSVATSNVPATTSAVRRRSTMTGCCWSTCCMRSIWQGNSWTSQPSTAA